MRMQNAPVCDKVNGECTHKSLPSCDLSPAHILSMGSLYDGSTKQKLTE